MHSSILLWRENVLKKLKDQSCYVQDRRSGKMSNCLFDKYKNSVMPHGKNMFQTESEMVMETMREYPSVLTFLLP